MALGACSASGEGFLSITERNEFTEVANKFNATSGQIIDAINTAAGKGDFTEVTSTTDPLFVELEATIAQMESQAQKLKGNPQAIANQMTTTARQWSTAAKTAVTAGIANDEASYKANVAQLNTLSTTFNGLIAQWNQIQAK